MESENYDEQFQRESKERLSNIIESKMRTTFIGAISLMQEEFGDLKEFSGVLNKLRKKILDNGNNNIRALMKELKQYEIRWTGEKIILPVKPMCKKGGCQC